MAVEQQSACSSCGDTKVLPSISVALPAKNEADNIGPCLSALTRQLYAGDEVLVLDNGSTDNTAGIADSFEQVRVIDAPDSRFDGDGHIRGLAQLRQLGVAESSNEIVASTDADTLPPDDWLDRIRHHFADDEDLDVLWGVATDTNGVPVRNLTGKYLTLLRGVSGCNHAFRREAFEQLDDGYVGWPMWEDVAIITRLSRHGKAVHDPKLEMRTDLDRRRYQTIPMLAGGGAGVASGALVGGPVGALAVGGGSALAGTELFYEQIADMHDALPAELPVHHDQVGLGLILGGALAGGTPGLLAGGVGSGILAHHVLTEGASAIPSDLFSNTDAVCRLDTSGEGVTIDCEPPSETTQRVTRILAGMAVGAVAGRGLWAAQTKF